MKSKIMNMVKGSGVPKKFLVTFCFIWSSQKKLIDDDDIKRDIT